jgi:diguanylate cyclase (GGDEF)-like protein
MPAALQVQEMRRSFAHRALLWLMLAGGVAAALATAVHYRQTQPMVLDLIIPPLLVVVFLSLAIWLHRHPQRWQQVAWANFAAGLLAVVIPAWYYPWLALNQQQPLVELLPPVSSAVMPLLLMLVVFVQARQVLIAALLSWALIATPILLYLGFHPEQLTSPRGHDLAMTLGPVMAIMAVYIGFHRNIEAAMQQLRQRQTELATLAERDALTGLYNRRAGESYLQKLQAGVDRGVGLILFDIDHFKRINDQHGHPAGDQVLREVARRCTEVLRTVDVLARWGGEEILVLVSVAQPAQALALAEQLRLAICSKPVDAVGTVSASFGVCMLDAGESQEQSLQRADQALYEAKRSGRNCVVSA